MFYMTRARTFGCPSRWRRFAATSINLFSMSRCPTSPPKKCSLKMVDAMASTCSVHFLRIFPALKGPPNICGSRNLLKDTMRAGCRMGLRRMYPKNCS